jgi:phage I-like protein
MKLSEALGQMTQERNTVNTEKEKLQQTIDALQKQYQESVTANERAREDAEKDRDKAQQTKEETIKAKDNQIAELQERNRTVTLELQQEKDTNIKAVAELKQHIDRLSAINISLREKQEQEEDLSFDQPDGTIEWVDNDTKLVWINLGEADNLKKKTTFSVYKGPWRRTTREPRHQGCDRSHANSRPASSRSPGN